MRLARGWVLVCVLLSLTLPAAWAQVATTAVQDTVYRADGTAAAGSVVVSWNAFTTALGNSVTAGSETVTIGAGGSLSLSLAPNAGATPMGSYYTAVYHLDDGHLNDGSSNREYWVIPVVAAGGTAIKLSAIRNSVLPLSVAMQTVSKGYVDTAIARALGGVQPQDGSTFVEKAGDTMTGPLILSGDPVLPHQAATKSYVDTSLAAIGGGGGASSGAAGGDLSGSYPNPTVSSVHAMSGSLDAVVIGGATPAAATFTSVTLSDASSPVTLAVTHPNVQITQISLQGSTSTQVKEGIFGGDYSGFQFGLMSNSGQLLYHATGSTMGTAYLFVDTSSSGTADLAFMASSTMFTASGLTATSLAGSGNAFACLDASGKLYRSATACN